MIYEDVIVEQTQTEMYESLNRIEDFDAKNEENLAQMSTRYSVVQQAQIVSQS